MPASNHELRPWRTADNVAVKYSWRSFFIFTTRQHGVAITIAILSTLASALFRPIAAIFFGKIFSVLTKFGAGTANAEDTLHGVAKWCTALAGLGGCASIVEGAFLSSWMVFGEAQAKTVRYEVFEGMLDKEMEWYDLRQDGIGSLLIRIQTYVKALSACILLTLQPNTRAPTSSLPTSGLPYFRDIRLVGISWIGFLLFMEAHSCHHVDISHRGYCSLPNFNSTLSSHRSTETGTLSSFKARKYRDRVNRHRQSIQWPTARSLAVPFHNKESRFRLLDSGKMQRTAIWNHKTSDGGHIR
jgi:hypothetical protein